jgi:hypothetical protein
VAIAKILQIEDFTLNKQFLGDGYNDELLTAKALLMEMRQKALK